MPSYTKIDEASPPRPIQADDVDQFIEAYEAALLEGPADLAQFLPPSSHVLYPAVVLELIRVDLEQSRKHGRPRRLEEYQPAFPRVFQDRDAVQELAFEEYRLRLQAGENPSPAEYQERFQVNTAGWPCPEMSLPPGPFTHDAAWDALNRFLARLQECEQPDDQRDVLLEAVRETLHADAVFCWHPGVLGRTVEIAGQGLSPQWCHDFARKILVEQGRTRSQVVLPRVNYFAADGGSAAQSAAFIRLSKSRSVWLVALSFNPKRRFGPTDLKILALARRMWLNQRQHAQTYERLKDTLFGLIRCLTAVIDARDPYTCGHSERVARIAVRLGKQMGLSTAVLSDVYLAGLLHDIGKIGVADGVLRKPGKLSPEEFDQLREHVLIGDRIVSTVKQLAHVRAGVRNHHERYDGQGYPDRLRNKQIPLLARLLAVADSCDAMMSARPYRAALPTSAIDATMMEGAGSQWDPSIVGHFMDCRHELYPICQRGIGHSVYLAVERTLQTAAGDGSVGLFGGKEALASQDADA
jgi:HD-GYP domain-containing protein (c-di-GMP phosphodiesterase class II)